MNKLYMAIAAAAVAVFVGLTVALKDSADPTTPVGIEDSAATRGTAADDKTPGDLMNDAVKP